MTTQNKPRGPWIHRFSIWFFTCILAVLFYWVLGFIVRDIETIQGPQLTDIETKYVDSNLIRQRDNLQAAIAATDRNIKNKRGELEILAAGSRNLQETMNQLIELQKLRVQKSIEIPDTEQENISASLQQFLDHQRQFQALNADIAQLTEERRQLDETLTTINRQVADQKEPAFNEYNRLDRRHRLILAGIQMAILVPLLAIGAWLYIKQRASIYFPLILGCGLATLVRVVLVMHRYFPAQYFKYILIVALLLVVGRILIYFIRVVAFPRAQWLIRQYREAYQHFLCPVCEYPIRTGPRRFLFWKRRTIHKNLPPGSAQPPDEPYTCPTCGSPIYEECPACHKIRHALLPHCQHCGHEKPIEPSP